MIDKPAASINLIKPEMISVKQLNAQINGINALRQRAGQPANNSKAAKLDVLDMMVSDMLLMQGAERDGIVAEAAEIDNAANTQKAQFEQQMRRTFTDAEFRSEVQNQTGYNWAQYREQLSKQIIQQKYLFAKRQAEIQASAKLPDNRDIEAFYRQNKTEFSNPDLVRYSQIFISTINLDSNGKKAAEQKANEAYKKYLNGSATFEQLVNDYTDDKNARYRNGDSGYIAYNDPNASSYLGTAFMDKLFSLKVGDVSNVVKSSIGYHIIKVTDYREAKLLELDDPILPTVTQTVREYIAQKLIAQSQNTAVTNALKSIIAELKNEAEIKIFEENID